MRRLITTLLLCLFCLAPLASGSPVDAVRIAVISDINGRYGSAEYHRRVGEAIAHIIDLAPDVVISTGDMVAGQRPQPHLSDVELESLWRAFHAAVHAPLRAAGIPLVMTPGNHDASAYAAYAAERAMYKRYHARHPPTLSARSGGNFPFYFAVNAGPLRLISLDATQPGALPQVQRSWLQRELAATEGRPTLVFGHLPLQPVSRGRERDILTDPALEKLLADAGVTAYLSGHHHAYYPGWRNGITMLSAGNLGGNQRMLVGTEQRTGFSFLLLEIAPDGALSVQARVAPDFGDTLNLATLPPTLGSGDGVLRRLDTREQDD